MGKEILDLDEADSTDYVFETQKSSGGAGSSQRRKNPQRGGFDLGAVNEFPEPGVNSAIGSGASDAILMGDEWYPTTDGSVPAIGGGSNSLQTKRALMRALTDSPGQDPENWLTITA